MKGHSVVRAHRAAALCELKQHECGLLPKLQPMYLKIYSKFEYVLFCFSVQSLCSYCLSFQFLLALSLFISLTVLLISFLIV